MRLALWRIRWDRLNTFNKIKRWNQDIPAHYLLWYGEEETTRPLFYQCTFSKDIWQQVLVTMDNPTGTAIGIQGICDEAEKLTRGAPLWSLIWSSIAANAWAIWRERNARWHNNRSRTAAAIAGEVTGGIKLTYQEDRFKKAHRQGSEARCFATWKSHCMRDLLEAFDNQWIVSIVSSGDLISNEGNPSA